MKLSNIDLQIVISTKIGLFLLFNVSLQKILLCIKVLNYL